MANGKREFVTRGQFFHLLVVYCSLKLRENRWIHANSINKNCFNHLLIFL